MFLQHYIFLGNCNKAKVRQIGFIFFNPRTWIHVYKSKYTNCSYHIKIHRNNKIFAFNSQRPFRPTFNCSSKKLKLNINYQRHVHSAIRCENFMVNSPRNFLFSKPLQGLGIRLADCDGCRRVQGHIVHLRRTAVLKLSSKLF